MVQEKDVQKIKGNTRLTPTQLKKTIDSTVFDFETTEQVPELTGIVGQERGRSVMKFGLNVNKAGYNLYVSGISGTGKMTFTKSIVNEVSERKTRLYDWCYINNFEDSYKPKVLKLPVGLGKSLQEDMKEFVKELKTALPRAFNEEGFRKEKVAVLRKFQEARERETDSMNRLANEYGFVIRQSNEGILTIPAKDGEPLTEEQYQNLSEEELNEINENSKLLREEVIEVTNRLYELEKEMKKAIQEKETALTLSTVAYYMKELQKKYDGCSEVLNYFNAVIEDIVNQTAGFIGEEQEDNDPLNEILKGKTESDLYRRYVVNLLITHENREKAPVIIADNPTYYNLIGKVEYENRMGMLSTDFTKIKKGYLHEANGGYLIIQAKDLFANKFAWEGMKRALLNKKLQIENIGEHSGLVATTSINPEPIPLNVKVILVGDMNIYQLLYNYDEDFNKLFKIRVDFDVEMDRTEENMLQMARFIHTHCENHQLRHFDWTAVAEIVTYSTRLAGNQHKLSTRFNKQIEIIYEADAWAELMKDDLVTAKHVKKAIQEKEYRSNLYEEKIHESIQDGSVLLDVTGEKVGQVNGLAVYNLGEYFFGKPTRITATTFIGKSGIINIERESKMGGNIHNKGVYILGGYLGQKFAQKFPLTLTAHIAFEQSYGGVDGDSASSTELYALLSSLSNLPIDQGIAVTGSVNQKGEIQPIGGVNEKIEGFFSICKQEGLTGKQGVLIPKRNVQNLMLKDEVIHAVEEGEFHVYGIRTVEEGIAILTNTAAEEVDKDGFYEPHTVFGKVEAQLKKYAEQTFDRKKTSEEDL